MLSTLPSFPVRVVKSELEARQSDLLSYGMNILVILLNFIGVKRKVLQAAEQKEWGSYKGKEKSFWYGQLIYTTRS